MFTIVMGQYDYNHNFGMRHRVILNYSKSSIKSYPYAISS
jgi:hypothetical protein